MKWVMFTKRTDDPKLAWIERTLTNRGIPSRRNGFSWHAPILEVPEQHIEAANALLTEPVDGASNNQTIDDVPDDDPTFGEGY